MTQDIRTLATERLEQEISELAAHIHAATCRWLLLVAELDRREAHRDWGCITCAHWLSLRCGVAIGAAREQVRVARRLAELPLVREAFAEGRLSYSKVRALSRVTEPHTEPELVETALDATAAQLERIVRGYRKGLSVDEANEVHARRELSCLWDDDGSLIIRGRLSAEEGEIVMKALEAAREPRPPRDVSAETPDVAQEPAQGAADALVRVAEASLAVGEADRTGGDRFQVVVHTDSASAGGAFEGGATACRETVERVSCDASVVHMSARKGRLVKVGRKTRTIPPSIRRALRSRDRCCRFPGCTNDRFVDAHHIHHWAHGGETALSNLVLLCRRHHRLLHEEGYGMEFAAGGALHFTRPDGRRIEPARRAAVDCVDLVRANGGGGLKVDPRTPVARSNGDRFSLDLTLSGLLELESRRRLPEPAGVSAGP